MRAVFVYLHVFVLVGAGIDFMQVRRLDASGTDRRRGDGAEDKRERRRRDDDASDAGGPRVPQEWFQAWAWHAKVFDCSTAFFAEGHDETPLPRSPDIFPDRCQT